MPDFLELVETYRAADASVNRLYSGEGATPRVRRGNPQYERRFVEALNLLVDVYEGRQPTHRLQEAMSTSDFSTLFADIIDRQLYAQYRAYAPIWSQFARRTTVPDFRTVKRYFGDGAEGKLEEVKELTEYPQAAITDGSFEYSVKKYGRRIDLSWETMINDDLGLFRTLPERLAKAARRSEDRFVSGLLADANGPSASFFTAGNHNIVNATNAGGGFTAVNPPLSIQALQQAFAVLANQLDEDDEPILLDGVILMVPPALEITARNILNATQILIDSTIGGGNPRNEGNGTGGQMLQAINWMRDRTTLVVNPYLPLISSSANGNTSWYLLAATSSERPAFEVGFLRGHEQPEIFMKSPNAVLVGGGPADPMMGDFDVDAIAYKVRHVFGGTLLFAKSAVASNGSGS